MEGNVADAYAAASTYVVSAVAAIGDEQWDQPGLGEWNVRELVGHLNRAHLLVVEYVERPLPPEPLNSTYFLPASIAERAREALALLGDDPVAFVTASATRARDFVRATDGDATVGSPMGTMTLAQYLPSRIAELTIHGLDLVRALGLNLPVPDNAIRESLSYVASIALKRRNGDEVLLALTGRGTLPEGYSVY